MRRQGNKTWLGKIFLILFAAVYGLGLSALLDSIASLLPAVESGDITAIIAFAALAPSVLMLAQGLFYVRPKYGKASIFIELRPIGLKLSFLLLPSFKYLYSGPGLEIVYPEEKRVSLIEESVTTLLNHSSAISRLALLLDARSPLELVFHKLSKAPFLPVKGLGLLLLLFTAPARQLLRLCGYFFVVVWKRWNPTPPLSPVYINERLCILDLARRVRYLGGDEYSEADLKDMRFRLGHCYNDPTYAPSNEISIEENKFAEYFASTHLKPHYYGIYLDLPVTLYAHSPKDLYDNCTKATDDVPYLADLIEPMQTAALLETEKQRLLALLEKCGPLGLANLDGRPIFGWELINLTLDLGDNIKSIANRIAGHHRHRRSQKLAQAEFIDLGWSEYLKSLGSLLFLTEHSAAELSKLIKEFKRGSAPETELQPLENSTEILSTLYKQQTRLNATELLKLAKKFYKGAKKIHTQLCTLNNPSFISAEEAETSFSLLPPKAENLSTWIHGWPAESLKLSCTLEKLRLKALDELLEAEDTVESLFFKRQQGENITLKAPQTFMTIKMIPPSPFKDFERIRAYSPSEQLLTGFGRSVIAFLILCLLCWQGHYQGNSRIIIYNGLATEVNVSIADQKLGIPAFGHTQLALPPGRVYQVLCQANGQTIESFKQRLLKKPGKEVYNIAAAAPLKETLVKPGQTSGESKGVFLGRPRWFSTEAESLFSEATPIRKKNILTLSGHGDMEPENMLTLFTNEEDKKELTELHARWDNTDSIWGNHWREIYQRHYLTK